MDYLCPPENPLHERAEHVPGATEPLASLQSELRGTIPRAPGRPGPRAELSGDDAVGGELPRASRAVDVPRL